MAVQNVVYRENWVGSIVVAGMKTIFAIFDPIWTYILALQAQNKELLEY